VNEGSENNQKKKSDLTDRQPAAGRANDDHTDKQSQMLGQLGQD
jgi:hypothetical protein